MTTYRIQACLDDLFPGLYGEFNGLESLNQQLQSQSLLGYWFQLIKSQFSSEKPTLQPQMIQITVDSNPFLVPYVQHQLFK